MVFVISQIFGFIAFILSIIAYHRNKKEKILSNMVLSNSFNLIQYILLDAYSGCVTKGIAILRDSFIIMKEKNKKLSTNIFLFIFIMIYIVAGVLTYDGILSIFPIISAMIYIIPIWNGNKETVKKTALLCYFLWLAYNIFVFSISGIVSNIVSIISTCIAVYNGRLKYKDL